MIQLLLADDHPIVRAGLRHLLLSNPDFAIAGEVGDAGQLLERLRSVPADLLLLDISMPGPGFLAVLAELRQSYPALRILVLSLHPEERYALAAFRAGAHGYVCKQRSTEELVHAIRHVHAGGRYVSPALADKLATKCLGGVPCEPFDTLSEREHQVLHLMVSGRSGKQIAFALRVSPKTVSTYRRRILDKLGIDSNAELIRYGVEHGLAGPSTMPPDA